MHLFYTCILYLSPPVTLFSSILHPFPSHHPIPTHLSISPSPTSSPILLFHFYSSSHPSHLFVRNYEACITLSAQCIGSGPSVNGFPSHPQTNAQGRTQPQQLDKFSTPHYSTSWRLWSFGHANVCHALLSVDVFAMHTTTAFRLV